MSDTFRYTLIPVILGGHAVTRLWADRLFWRFRVRSYILSHKHSPALFLAITLRRKKLHADRKFPQLILTDLLRLAQEHPDKLLVLIGTDRYYNGIIREHRAELEKYYIISDPQLSFLELGGQDKDNRQGGHASS